MYMSSLHFMSKFEQLKRHLAVSFEARRSIFMFMLYTVYIII